MSFPREKGIREPKPTPIQNPAIQLRGLAAFPRQDQEEVRKGLPLLKRRKKEEEQGREKGGDVNGSTTGASSA